MKLHPMKALRHRFIKWLGGVIAEATAEADARRFAEFERLHRKVTVRHAKVGDAVNQSLRAGSRKS